MNGQAVERQEQQKRRGSEMITDCAAKMSLHGSPQSYKMAVAFSDGEPSEQVRRP